jgi:hypothetical protein
MTRAPLAVLAAALLFAGCGKDGEHSSAAADSTATAAPAPPSGLLGAPDRARIGADSADAAVQRREDEVNQLSQPNAPTP